MNVCVEHSTIYSCRVVNKQTSIDCGDTFVYVEHSSMIISKVVFEDTVGDVDRGISNASHTSSNCLSCSCVECEDTICQVHTEVVVIINVQYTTIGSQVVKELR